MTKYFIIFFLLVSCSQSLKKDDHINLNFSQDLSFKNFKLKLEEYATNQPYPNLEN
tara:strand:+ start:1973 stop:2140 length:168 start_codon:yes stop_codon:yes gene_type:complete